MAANRYVYEQPWQENAKFTNADFSRMYLDAPTKIGPAITFMLGKDNISLNPITMMTEGVGAVMTPLKGQDYEYDVMSNIIKQIPIAVTVTGTTCGIGYQTFKVQFAEKHFANGYTIISPNKYKLRIVSDPKLVGTNWEYTVQIAGSGNPNGFVPASELTQGTFFTNLYANVSAGGSRGNSSNITAPAKIRGQIGVLRKSYAWEGAVANKTMTIEFNGSKLFWPFQQYQIEKQWQMEVENSLVYSTSNRADDNTYNQLDENGNPIIEGDGLYAQIGSKDTFGLLSESKIDQVVRDTYTGMKDAENKVITLMTGLGGAQDFDKAIKAGILGSGFTVITDKTFIEGAGYQLRSTGYFAAYDHRDGYKIVVKKTDLNDFGPVAVNAPKHPITGLSLESHRLTFLDTAHYDGAPNIMGLYDENIQFSRDAVLGVGSVPPGFPSTTNRSSDVHAHSIHYMKSCGVVIRRPNTSIDLQCTLS
jgi:hypothetical protein